MSWGAAAGHTSRDGYNAALHGRVPIPAAARIGAIAQLGECLDRTQEVAGSSPASSIARVPSPLEGVRAFLVLAGAVSGGAWISCEPAVAPTRPAAPRRPTLLARTSPAYGSSSAAGAMRSVTGTPSSWSISCWTTRASGPSNFSTTGGPSRVWLRTLIAAAAPPRATARDAQAPASGRISVVIRRSRSSGSRSGRAVLAVVDGRDAQPDADVRRGGRRRRPRRLAGTGRGRGRGGTSGRGRRAGADRDRTTIGSSCQSAGSMVATETGATAVARRLGFPGHGAVARSPARRARAWRRPVARLVVEEEPAVEDLDLVLKDARVPVVERLGPLLAGGRRQLTVTVCARRPRPHPGQAQVALLAGDHPARRLLDPRVEHRGGRPIGRVDDHAQSDADIRRQPRTDGTAAQSAARPPARLARSSRSVASNSTGAARARWACPGSLRARRSSSAWSVVTAARWRPTIDLHGTSRPQPGVDCRSP